MKTITIKRKKVEEGISDYLPSADSIYAFGRNAADTATFGGYKYARAGADYAAKNIASKLGYGKGTDYDTELKQEKDKLARDDIKNPQAAAAGDIAGYAALAIAPELPVVGRAIGSTMGAVEKASKVPYYVGLARKAVGMEEEAPANAVGGGNIAALGVGPNGEPGRAAKMMPMVRRGKFAGKPTFIVSSATFNALREAKKSRKHWRKYLDEDSAYHDLREYAKKCKGPIIVEDERTGACMYVRYGKGGSLQEAWTNQVDRSGARHLSLASRNIKDYEDNTLEKIGNYDKSHSIYTHSAYNIINPNPVRHYHLVHNETGHITHSVNGSMKNGVLKIDGAGASEKNKELGTKTKMEDFYHHLLRRGASHEASGSKERNRFPVALKGTSHSGPSEDEEGDYGAQKVWRNLAKKRGATVHGWEGGKKGKPVNIGKAEDPSETHADPHGFSDWTGEPNKGSDPEAGKVGKMALVASVNLPKKKKLGFRRKK